MQKKILEFLKKKTEYISGEEISRALGISRQGLWKYIQQLRDGGYDIVAVPHLGYKLVSAPDRLFAFEVKSGLDTKFIAKDIHYFDSLGSTMNVAMQLGIAGARTGALVLSEAQTKGRGRFSRHWASSKYKGIYFSLILRPKILPYQAPILTLLSAVSICEAIKGSLGLEVKIKWPNDILLDNKKLGGILTELNAEMDEIRFVVIGIGLNVNNELKALPEGAASLETSRIILLQEILRKIESNYLKMEKEGPGFIADKWRQHNITLGKRVKIAYHKDFIEGQAMDIDADGSLLVRKDSGIIQKVTAGEIVHCQL